MSWVLLMVLAFFQNVSFSIVSRSRNRSSKAYHFIAAIASNGVWYLTAKYLIVSNHMTFSLFVPYTAGTVLGSSAGQSISMWIEKKLRIGV